jgi:glycosyltransferase involved in cell wall biosynthesis
MKILAWPAFRKRAANPHAALLAQALRDLGVDVEDWTLRRACWRRADLWHLHHPDTVVYARSRVLSALGTFGFALLLALARARGTRVLWTVHDLGSNDRLHPRLEAWFWRFFVRRLDGYITLSASGRRRALERFPALRRLPGFVVPHGHYLDAYPDQVARDTARRALDLPASATVLLHFGLLRPYKNVPHLVRTFRALADPDLLLVVAGNANDEITRREVETCAAGDRRVRLRLRWAAPAEVAQLFAACDLVVLPYRRILNSGTALLALSCARPVLLPELGAMPDLQQAFGAEWVRLYRGELTAGALDAACRWARDTPRQGSPDLTGRDWHDLALQTRSIYARLGVGAAETTLARPGAHA